MSSAPNTTLPGLPPWWRETIISVATGTAAVALITLFAFRFHLNLPTAAFLHLIVVVLLARHAGFWVASAISMVAVTLQTYFLVPPFLSFSVADANNWIALAAFEYCALTVSRLSSEAAHQARVAERRRADTEGLYEISRLVLLMDRRLEPGPEIAAAIARVFDCEGVGIFDSASVRSACAGARGLELERQTRDSFLMDRDSRDESGGAWFRVLRMGHRGVGALAVCGRNISETVANALASLVAVSIERARSFENESRMEAARQSEQLRTAVLDALAHDVKTPLTTIRAASSGLLETGLPDPNHRELVALIDDESARLEQMTDRLLRLARLDSREVRLKREPVHIPSLLRRTVLPMRERSPDRMIRIKCPTGELGIEGDEHLLSMALAQLVDNALKYSSPDSGVTVRAERKGDAALISVHNFGPPIPPAEIERVFERFYRAAGAAHRVSGTGLGLSITRKIALAHGGRVWATSDETNGATFYLALPLRGTAMEITR